MAEFVLVVPGYVAVPSRGGPDVFFNVDGLGWTDQQGLRSGTDIVFDGHPDLIMDFHFPFTTPLMFGAGPGANGVRMTVTNVFVTFFVRRTIPVSTVRVNRIRVFDRLAVIFDSQPLFGPLDMPELAGAPPGSAGRMENETQFINSTVFTRNLHDVGPRLIGKSIGVTVSVDFGTDGGVIGFTGAGIRLTS